MIIVAILKHVAGKSADYGAALDYLKYEHDEVLKRPLLDANGNWVLRRDILLEGINCEPELFDVECEMLNAQYHKNQNYDEIKTHHYLISFDPADKDECGLTGEQAQAIGMEYVKANFPGHQALVCTHMDGHNGSGNIHVHIVINSLRKLDVPQQPFMERPIDCKAGYKHHLTKDYLKHLQQSLMNISHVRSYPAAFFQHDEHIPQEPHEHFQSRSVHPSQIHLCCLPRLVKQYLCAAHYAS